MLSVTLVSSSPSQSVPKTLSHQWRFLWSQWVRRVVQTLLILTPPPNCEYWDPKGCCSMSKWLNFKLIFIFFFLIRVWVGASPLFLHPWRLEPGSGQTDIPYLNLKHPPDQTHKPWWDTNTASLALSQTHQAHRCMIFLRALPTQRVTHVSKPTLTILCVSHSDLGFDSRSFG